MEEKPNSLLHDTSIYIVDQIYYLAREDRFKIIEEWYTWMNYYRSDELIAEYLSNEEYIYKYRLSDQNIRMGFISIKRERFGPKQSRYRKNRTGR